MNKSVMKFRSNDKLPFGCMGSCGPGNKMSSLKNWIQLEGKYSLNEL